VKLLVDLGFHTFAALTFRLINVNTAERFTPEGIEATSFVENTFGQWEADGLPIVVHSFKGRSFTRWIGDIYGGDQSLSEHLVKNGYDVGPY
jgi:endonuclease YncB( thermonuclease family)